MAKVKCPRCGKYTPKDYIPGGGIFVNLYKMHSCWTPRDEKGKFKRPSKPKVDRFPMYCSIESLKKLNEGLGEYYEKQKNI